MPLIAEAPIPSELLESPADRRSHSAHSLSKALKKRVHPLRPLLAPSRARAEAAPRSQDSHHRPRAHRRSPSVESADPSTYRQLNQYLARTVLWATLVHILVYAGTFIGVFGASSSSASRSTFCRLASLTRDISRRLHRQHVAVVLHREVRPQPVAPRHGHLRRRDARHRAPLLVLLVQGHGRQVPQAQAPRRRPRDVRPFRTSRRQPGSRASST